MDANPAANFYARNGTARGLGAALRLLDRAAPAWGTRGALRLFFTPLPWKLAMRRPLPAPWRAQRWAFEHFSATLGRPFHAAFTVDDTGTEKPDPAFFHRVFAFVEAEGASKDDILHVAQSQYHDIGVSRALGLTNCWIERRHAQPGYGGTIEPASFTTPDYHFTSMAALADAADAG